MGLGLWFGAHCDPATSDPELGSRQPSAASFRAPHAPVKSRGIRPSGKSISRAGRADSVYGGLAGAWGRGRAQFPAVNRGRSGRRCRFSRPSAAWGYELGYSIDVADLPRRDLGMRVSRQRGRYSAMRTSPEEAIRPRRLKSTRELCADVARIGPDRPYHQPEASRWIQSTKGELPGKMREPAIRTPY